MGSILASAIITNARPILNDETATYRWADATLLGFLNIGQRVIACLKPDSSVSTTNVSLVAGTKQSITGVELVKATRNMGSGSTAGTAIDMTTMEVLDSAIPDWHTHPSSATVQYVAVDTRHPQVFYVYPPQPTSTTQQIETFQIVIPTAVTINQAINISDIYEPMLLDYVLYRAFSMDTDNSDFNKANDHFQKFISGLGGKVTAEQVTEAEKVANAG